MFSWRPILGRRPTLLPGCPLQAAQWLTHTGLPRGVEQNHTPTNQTQGAVGWQSHRRHHNSMWCLGQGLLYLPLPNPLRKLFIIISSGDGKGSLQALWHCALSSPCTLLRTGAFRTKGKINLLMRDTINFMGVVIIIWTMAYKFGEDSHVLRGINFEGNTALRKGWGTDEPILSIHGEVEEDPEQPTRNGRRRTGLEGWYYPTAELIIRLQPSRQGSVGQRADK